MSKSRVPGYVLKELTKLARKITAQPDFQLGRMSKKEVERVLRDPQTVRDITSQLNATQGFSYSPVERGLVNNASGTMMATRKGTEFGVTARPAGGYTQTDIQQAIDGLLNSPQYGMYGGLRRGRVLGGYEDAGQLVMDPSARFSRQSMADLRGYMARQNKGYDLGAGANTDVTLEAALRGAGREATPYLAAGAGAEGLRRLLQGE